MTGIYQNVGFHFKVSFLKGSNDNIPHEFQNSDVSFQSVSGLDVSLNTEAYKEGGENRFEHVMPVRTKYGKLTLKRGFLLPSQSGLTKWFQDAFQNMKVRPIQTVVVELLNPEHASLQKWTLAHVFPTSWKVAEFNAERGEVLIETLELNYNRFKLG